MLLCKPVLSWFSTHVKRIFEISIISIAIVIISSQFDLQFIRIHNQDAFKFIGWLSNGESVVYLPIARKDKTEIITNLQRCFQVYIQNSFVLVGVIQVIWYQIACWLKLQWVSEWNACKKQKNEIYKSTNLKRNFQMSSEWAVACSLYRVCTLQWPYIWHYYRRTVPI